MDKPRRHRRFRVDLDDFSFDIEGDPDMADETLQALVAMARAAYQAIIEGTLKEPPGAGE